MIRWFVGSAVGFMLLIAGPIHAQTLYGIKRNTFPTPDDFITLNTTTAAATVIGPIPAAVGPIGLCFRAGKLYTFDGFARQVHELNPATGGSVGLTSIGLPVSGWNGGGFAIRADGIGYLGRGNSGTEFFSFDLTAGTNNLITATQNISLVALALNSSNVLYGTAGNSLYTIDQTTGAMTLVGATGILGPRVITGLSFDASNNLFAMTLDQSGAPWPSFLYSVNATTGTATFIANVSLDYVDHIAFGTPGPPATAGTTITQSGGTTTVTEGGATDTYTVVLNTAPTANVTITLNPGTQVTVAPATLTFTPANWNVAQTVTVTAVDDALVEGAHTGTITHTSASADAAYNVIAIANVTANITDNDGAPPPVIPPPAPVPGGGLSEGSYAGCAGLGAANNNEGTFGFGRHFGGKIGVKPSLQGPFRDPAGTFRVYNAAHLGNGQSPDTDRSFGLAGGGLVALSVLAAAGVVYLRRRYL